MEHNAFFFADHNDWQQVGEGISRQITGFNYSLMMVKVKFEAGAIGALHTHVHSQASFVASGIFEVTIKGEMQLLKSGDCFFAEPNQEHGVKCIEAGVLVDVFNPLREDFLKK